MIRNHLQDTARFLAAKTLQGLLVAGVAAALSGCQTNQEVASPIDTNYKLRHPIAIVEKDRTLTLFVVSGRSGLTPDQRTDVLAFAQTWRDEGTGRFVIEYPTNTSNAHAASIALGETRSILRAFGVPQNAISVHSYRVSRDMLAVIRVNYPRLATQVAGCGQWPNDLGPLDEKRYFENVQYWNFGCANRRNLAAMVANPNDLVQPRAEDPAYTARRTTVLDKYRKGESPATVYPDANKGAISDLGK
jgi:pilus assembly protein CpaD